MLTGARCGHHAKVTPDPFQRDSEEAAPPQDPLGSPIARRLATTNVLPDGNWPVRLQQVGDDGRELGISANGSVYAGSSRRQSGFMSVQSNSGSGGGSLEATPSWSQLSSSPTISQQHITAATKSKEGI